LTARVREVHHVALSVRDLAASEAFYGGILGLRRTLDMMIRDPVVLEAMGLRPGVQGRSVYFQGPSQLGQLELIQWQGEGLPASPPKRPGDPGMFLLSYEVAAAELDEILERARAAGVRIFAEKRVAILENYGPITVTIFEDPDGVLVELVSLPTREQIKAFRAAAAGNPGA
jgi:catechol 2,3-dioxygenase-like lactoylglutathione lyase family enzyme